jgi:hypothetical protein
VHEISVGSIAEWVTAVAAFLALVFAARAARAAQKSTDAAIELLGLEKTREDRADERDRARAKADAQALQADYVAAWIRSLGIDAVSWVVTNGSALPIYDVVLLVIDERTGEVAIRHDVPMIPPGGTPSPPFKAVGHVGDPLSGILLGLVVPLPAGSKTHFGVGSIEFRDTAGRTWRRNYKGVLEPISDHYIY